MVKFFYQLKVYCHINSYGGIYASRIVCKISNAGCVYGAYIWGIGINRVTFPHERLQL